jgi:hypothetical protein
MFIMTKHLLMLVSFSTAAFAKPNRPIQSMSLPKGVVSSTAAVEGWGTAIGDLRVYSFEDTSSVSNILGEIIEVHQSDWWGFWQGCLESDREIADKALVDRASAMKACIEYAEGHRLEKSDRGLMHFLTESIHDPELESISSDLRRTSDAVRALMGSDYIEYNAMFSAWSSEFRTAILISERNRLALIASYAWYD